MKSLYENKRAIDANIVWSEILRLQKNNAFLTEDYVLSLTSGDYIVHSGNSKDYAIALKFKSLETIKDSHCNKVDSIRGLTIEKFAKENLKQAIEFNDLLENAKGFGNSFDRPDILEDDIFRDIDEKLEGKISSGFPCGIYDIDKKINGFERGRVYNFTGAPGTGKTNFALQVALHCAKNGVKTLYGSFEMGVPELSLRLVCQNEELNSWAIDDPNSFIENRIEKGTFKTKAEGIAYIKSKISQGRQNINNITLDIFRPKGGANIDKVKNAIEKYLMQNKGLDLLIIDHTDLMHNHQNSHADLYVIYKKLKDFAVDYNISILALHQFNRAELLNSPDYIPTVYALKGGQAIHDNADVIMLLYRPAIYSELIKRKPELKHICEVSYAKRRGGAQRGNTELRFNGIKFSDMMDISR